MPHSAAEAPAGRHHHHRRGRRRRDRGVPGRPAGRGPRGGVVVIHHLPGYDARDQGDDPAVRRPGLRRDLPEPVLARGPRRRPGRRRRHRARAGRDAGRAAGRRRRGRGGRAAGAAVVQREGRRHRALQRRPARLPGRGQPATCRRPWTATAPSSSATPPEGFPLRVTPARRPDGAAVLPAARALRRARTRYPSPEQVEELAQGVAGQRQGRTSSTSFDDAGHAFFAVDRPGYRQQAATAGLAAHRGLLRPAPWPEGTPHVHLRDVHRRRSRARQGRDGLVRRHRSPRCRSTTRCAPRPSTR